MKAKQLALSAITIFFVWLAAKDFSSSHLSYAFADLVVATWLTFKIISPTE